MLRKLFAVAVLFAPILAFAQNNCSGSLTLGPCTVTPVAIVVTLSPPSAAVGQTSVARAQLQISDGSLNAFITDQCTAQNGWSTSDATKATISGNIVTAVAAGTANISCSLAGLTGSAAFTVTTVPIITNPTCATQPCILPAATQSVAYTPGFQFAASGGVLPYTWTNSVGAPPTGMTLSSGGLLNGTPSGTGTTTWTVQVADSGAHTQTVQVSLTVNASAACGSSIPTTGNYCSRQDTAASSGSTANGGNPPAALMGLNCATPGNCGTSDCVLDDNNSGPAQAYICRVTDFTTEGAGNFVTVTSSSTVRQSNSDSTIFTAIYSVGSATAFFSYTEGAPPTILRKGNATQDKNGLLFGTSVNWSGHACTVATCGTSAATSYLFYSNGSTAGFPTRDTLYSCVLDTTNAAWTASTGLTQNLAAAITCTSLSDPFTWNGLTSYLTGQDGPQWNRWMAAGSADSSADKNDAWSCTGYRYSQDQGSLVNCFNRSTNAYQWLDARTGQTCGSSGMPCGATTGFGPLPAPTGQTYTWQTTGGSLPCSSTTTYRMGMTYTVLGQNGMGGESAVAYTNVPATGGSGSTCAIAVTPPTANPGGGTGLNGPLTATGYNNYFGCTFATGGAPCTPAPTMVNLSTAPAQPVISSVTGCTTGASSNTVTYWAVIRSGGNSTSSASITSQPSSLTVTSNIAPGCTVTLTNPVPTGMTADILRDDPSIRGCTIAAGGTSCRDATQSPLNYANQTVTIGTSGMIASVATTSVGPPSVNYAGVPIHNFRMDDNGTSVQFEAANAFQSSQNNAPNANTQYYWVLGTGNIIPAQQNVQTCTGGLDAGTVSYAAGHWTNGFGSAISWPGSTGRAKGIVTPISNSCAAMNAAQFFMNAANGGLDTQSGDQHLNHSNSVNSTPDTPVFRDAYPLSSPYALPSVPYDGEITAWQFPVSITSVSRAANVVTVTTSGAHNLQSGANVTLNGVTDTTFNGAGTGITVTGATTFTFAQTGANSSSSGGTVDRPMVRFCHTWASGASKNGTGSTFNSTPRGGVAQDGKKGIFVSDMERNGNGLQGTSSVGVGCSDGSTTCTSATARYDLYVCQYK